MKDLADTIPTKEVPALIVGEKGLLTSIAATGIPVILGHELKNSPVLRSKYARFKVPFSSYDSPEFINELCRLGEVIGRKMVILSDDDRALLNISKNRQELKPYYLFLYPENNTVEKLLDKQSFSELAADNELPYPKSYEVNSKIDLSITTSKITYPCIIKPAQRHYWWGKTFTDTLGYYKKAIKCENIQELEYIYGLISKINPSVVIQEYVQGEDDQHYSANIFADKNGVIRGFYIAQKLRVYPVSAGTGTYIKTVNNKEVEQIIFEIVSKLKLKGLLNIQFKKDSKTNKYMLMEIHIRNSLWSLLGGKAGANLGEQYYKYLTSKYKHDQKILTARPDVKYINLSHDILAALEYYREDKLTLYQWMKSLQGDRVFALTSISDPLPAFYKIGSTVKNRMKNFSQKLFRQSMVNSSTIKFSSKNRNSENKSNVLRNTMEMDRVRSSTEIDNQRNTTK